MARIAAVFPNEGSQYVGMGKDFYAKSLSVRKFYDDTEKLLNTKIAKVCFLGPKEDQDILHNAQLATFLNDVAFFDPLVQNRRKPEALTGVGVGEIAALVVSEAIPFPAAVQFVSRRAKLLADFAAKHGGNSLSLTGITLDQLTPLLKREEGEIMITHYLAPDTFIVWGPGDSVKALQAELQGVKQVKTNLQLPRGPLYTSLAQELESTIGTLLGECLGAVALKTPKITFHHARGGEMVSNPDMAREVLVKQLSSPIDWVSTVKAVIFRGFRTWVEIGPGRLYTTMVKKIDVDTRNTNVEDAKTLSTTVKVTG
jgi:[acyl-carrier-protein] S-malonyltransferase